jgi:2,4-dienoyl-CoA reductase-like NADH-dependent reductase (Old Yellow Enzyme family)
MGEAERQRIFAPSKLRGVTLRNRVIKTATYEGMCPGGIPSPALTKHHRDLAAGGVGMTTVAYCAVSPNGRTFSEQMVMREDIVPRLREVTDAVHAEGAAASLQLGPRAPRRRSSWATAATSARTKSSR